MSYQEAITGGNDGAPADTVIDEKLPLAAVVFDVTGVLTTNDGAMEWVKESIDTSRLGPEAIAKLSEAADRGSLTADQVAGRLSAWAGVPSQEVWPQIRERIVPNPHMIDLVRRISAGEFATAVLTNYTGEWMRDLLGNKIPHDLFDGVVISAEHHSIKPETEIYKALWDCLGLSPEQIVFVDDRLQNTTAAQRLGMRAVHYTTVDNLELRLEDNGIKVEPHVLCTLDDIPGYPLRLQRGISPEHVSQLISRSATEQDPVARDGDGERFASHASFKKWRAQGSTLYTLVAENNNLAGMWWLRSKRMPPDQEYNFGVEIDEFPVTVAARLYGPAKGKGLGSKVLEEITENFFALHPEITSRGVWAETGITNNRARRSLTKGGYRELSPGNNDGRIVYGKRYS